MLTNKSLSVEQGEFFLAFDHFLYLCGYLCDSIFLLADEVPFKQVD